MADLRWQENRICISGLAYTHCISGDSKCKQKGRLRTVLEGSSVMGRSARLISALAILCALAACDQIPGTPYYDAHKAVRAMMNDPDAAQFRTDFTSKDGKAICGFVNGKNAFGAYVGFAPYVYNKTTHIAEISQGDPDFAEYFRETEINADDRAMFQRAYAKLENACDLEQDWDQSCLPGSVSKEILENCSLWHGSPLALKTLRDKFVTATP